jgi:excisionase family DNA binding protein
MMNEGKGKIIASIIIAVALIYSASILRDAYFNKSYPQNDSVTAYLNTDLSKLEDAILNHDKDILTVNEAASYLGINEDNFITMFYGGKLDSLPYVTIGGNVIFSRKALNEWIENASKSHIEIKRD